MGLTFLVSNDLECIMPLTVSVVTRTDTSNTQNVVRLESTNVRSARSVNDVADVLIINNHVTDEDELVDWDIESEINNVAVTNRSALPEQDKELSSDQDRLFTDDIPQIIPNANIITRTQLIEMQHSDTSLAKLFELAKLKHATMDVIHFEIRSEVLVRCARDQLSPVGLEVTQIVVPSNYGLNCCT